MPTLATGGRIAGFGAIAEIGVIADQCRSADAFALLAVVLGGANVTIAASGGVHFIETSNFGVAGIIGARVAIVTDAVRSRGANSLHAEITDGALVAVFAGKPLVVRNQCTATCCGVTVSGQTDGIGAGLRLGAGDHGIEHRLALVGPLFQVAKESAVAEVAILQSAAISILLAIAGHIGA